jgi:hypothetical protein
MAKTFTLDTIRLEAIQLSRNGTDPVEATVTYTVTAAQGQFPATTVFTPSVPSAIQAQLNTLWTQALSAAKSREGIA